MTLGDARLIIAAGLALLPERLSSPAAVAMLLAVAMQESRLFHRRQIRGPARGYWQFEPIGVAGVLEHPASSFLIADVLRRLDYAPGPGALCEALADNDMLAVVFARLLLLTLPAALPGPDDADEGWRQYIAAWRPGKPRPETWAAYYSRAWHYVGQD